jgi:hypothetical protein
MNRVRTVAVGATVSFAILVLVAVTLIFTLGSRWSGGARARLVAGLSEQLDAEVTLDDLRVQVFPGLRAEGRGLTIRHRGRRDVPPLLSISHFSAESSIAQLLRGHVSRLDLDGLDIEIPPNDDAAEPAGRAHAITARTVPHGLVIDQLLTNSARLAINPREKGKDPKVWNIHRLKMASVSIDQAMPFEAVLTNAVPPGEIDTQGTFGPWQSDKPARTPLDGAFTFENAQLAVFKGIGGVLSARGHFGGVLERIDIHGQTETPDFEVEPGRHPLALHTRYHAIVDATNGNTYLEEVDASFLQTSLVAKGSIVDEPGKPGRTVALDVSIERGRIEDVLALAVDTPKPPMTGALQLTTRLVLPPGEQDVVKKLRLKGRFSISGTRFTTLDVQQKVNELSRRGRGMSPEEMKGHVTSRFVGDFTLAGGRLDIPKVTFDVPGSVVELGGTYDLLPEQLNFTGTLFMDVKVSDTTTGIKRLLLKVIDPLFNRDGGGSALPIRITGKRSDPDFGLDRSRLFKNPDKRR